MGDVNILKGADELNASKVTIFVNKEKKPTKFVADGNVSFSITSKKGTVYKGVAGRAIYLPNKKEYYFYDNVHLQQLNEKKEIMGDEVVLKTIDGKAYAKGMKKEPVIMIFNIDEEKK
jgi:lipopolysaccharide export system protein LptA